MTDSNQIELKYNFAALEWLEDQGLNVLAENQLDQQLASPSGVRKFVQAGLRGASGQEVSEEDARAAIDRHGLTAVAAAITAAITRDFGITAPTPEDATA